MSGEKTLAPTEKRRREAAQKGDVLRSREAATAIAVLIGAAWLATHLADFHDALKMPLPVALVCAIAIATMG